MIENWRLFNEHLESPDLFIDFGFYSLVSACLGRKVWIGQDLNKLHLNTYTVFVGPPGVGKGRVITRIKEILRAVQKKGVIQYGELTEMPSITDMAVPLGPDEITKSRLISLMASLGNIEHLDNGKLLPHASIYVCLDELSSLIDAYKAKDTIGLLNNLFDCLPTYTAGTQQRKEESIMNGCLTLLAGTSPVTMKQCHDIEILRTGFSARTWYVYAPVPRKRLFESGRLDKPQLEARDEMLRFVSKISQLVGSIKISQEATALMKDWYENNFERERHNRSHHLEDYYTRKRRHLQVLAGLIAISENQTLEKEISGLHVFKAFDGLKRIEKSMDVVFSVNPRNPIATVRPIINEILETSEPLTLDEIYSNVSNDLNLREFVESIRMVSKQHGIAYLDCDGTLKLTSNKKYSGGKRMPLLVVEQRLNQYATRI